MPIEELSFPPPGSRSFPAAMPDLLDAVSDEAVIRADCLPPPLFCGLMRPTPAERRRHREAARRLPEAISAH